MEKNTHEVEIVEASAGTPANVDIEAAERSLRSEHAQSTVTASTQVFGDAVTGA
jgi:hypothetical protein